MIKNRSFMIGLGFGLMIGALLLQLMTSAGLGTPTKAQIIQEAARLNLKVTEASDQLMTEEEWKALAQQDQDGDGQPDGASVSSEASGSPAATPVPASSPSVPGKAVQPSAPVKPNSADAAIPPSAPAQNPPASAAAPSAPSAVKPGATTVALRIPGGVTLTEVADILAGAGIISNKDEFLLAAMNRKVQTKIQYGLYGFQPGQSIESIINQLITVK